MIVGKLWHLCVKNQKKEMRDDDSGPGFVLVYTRKKGFGQT